MSEKSFKKSEFKRTIDLGKTDRGQDTDLIRVWRESSGEEKAISLGDINAGLIGNYVPYTGATDNVNLGEKGISVGYVKYDTTPTSTPTDQGTSYWDIDDNTLAIIMNGTTLKVGEDQYYPVKNQTGVLIPKGTAVRFAGTLGASGRLLIVPFLADGSVSSSRFMGVTSEDIDNGADGKVMWFGRIRGINTNAFNEGDILYASTTVAGGFQTTIPEAPNNIVQVCAVINKSTTQGIIFVRPTLGSNINKDEGVKLTTPTTGDLLQLQVSGLWENVPVSSIYTPVTIGSPANGLSISGTQVLTIGLASTSDNGALSSTDWNTFNGKIGGSLTSGRIPFATEASTLSDDSGLTWNNATKVLTAIGQQIFQGSTASDTAPLGTELATTGSGTNWTGSSFATGYTHTIGSTQPLTTALAAVNGTYYQIAYTITGRTTGSITINFGGTSTAGITATGAVGPLSTSTANLEIVPTTDFNGTIVLSVRSIGTSSATTTIRDSVGTARLEIRAASATDNTLVGLFTGRRITTGTQNTFFGVNAGSNTTTGSHNIFFGVQSGILNTTGTFNAYFGSSAGSNGTSASNNIAIGGSALFFNTTGSNNIAFGGNAGGRISDGVTANTVTSNSIFIGQNTRANANNETNQIVIGHTAIGGGSNTTTIGNSSTVSTRLPAGSLWINTTSGTNTLDVNGTARIRTISNLGSAATSVLVPSATGVVSLRTLAELASDGTFITGTGTSGRVAFWSGTGTQSSSANFIWDNTNNRLGIGISPTVDFEISKSVGAAGGVTARVINTNSAGQSAVVIRNDNTYGALEIFGSTFVTASLRDKVTFTAAGNTGFDILLFNNSSTADFSIKSRTTLTERFRLFGNTGNILIQNGGTYTDNGFLLDVAGTVRIQTSLMVGSAASATNTLDVNGTARIRTINNLGVSATNVLVPDATGVVSLRTASQFLADAGGISGTIASGQVAFGTGVNTVGGDAGLTWDNVNKRLNVIKTDTNQAFRLITTENTSNNFGRIEWKNDHLTTYPGIAAAISASIGNFGAEPYLSFFTNTTTTSAGSLVERMRITSAGNVGIGVTNPAFLLHLAATSAADIVTRGYSDVAGASGNIALGKSRGTLASPLAISSGDRLGGVVFSGYNGSSFVNSAAILGLANENYTTSVSGSDISFEVTTTGQNTRTQRMRLFGATGNLLIQNGGTFTDNGYRLEVNGTARIITSLAIGNITPTNTLDVNGTARIRTINNLGVSATNVLVPDATGVVSLRTASQFLADAGGISGTIASGQVAFGTGVNTVGGDSGFIWDNTNKRIDVGASQANKAIFRSTVAAGNNFIDFVNTTGRQSYVGMGTANDDFFIVNAKNNAITFATNNTNRWQILATGVFQSNGGQTINALGGELRLTTSGGTNSNIIIAPQGTGLVMVGPSGTPTNTLDVNGTARIRTISNLGSAATSVLVPSATGVLSLRTLAELASDGLSYWTLFGSDIYRNSKVLVGGTTFSSSSSILEIRHNSSAIHSNGLTLVNDAQWGWGSRITFRTPLTSGGFTPSDAAAIEQNFDSSNNYNLTFYTTTSGTLTQKAVLNSLGSLLIGTGIDTGEKLNVNGKARIQDVENATGDFVTISPTGRITKRTSSQAAVDLGTSSFVENSTETSYNISDVSYTTMVDFTSLDLTGVSNIDIYSIMYVNQASGALADRVFGVATKINSTNNYNQTAGNILATTTITDEKLIIRTNIKIVSSSEVKITTEMIYRFEGVYHLKHVNSTNQTGLSLTLSNVSIGISAFVEDSTPQMTITNKFTRLIKY